MTLDQIIDLLTVAAVFDFRSIGEADAMAWHVVIGDLDFADAKTAVLAHYADSRDRIMPADVRKRVKAIRRERLERTIMPAPAADNPGKYLEEFRRCIHEIASGFSIDRAIDSG